MSAESVVNDIFIILLMLHIDFDFICITNIPSINHRSPPLIAIMVVDYYSVCILNIHYRNFVLHIVIFIIH